MIAEILVRLTFAAVLLAATLAAGCAPSTPGAAQERGTAVVIFVDFSQSVGSEDLAGFRREIDQEILPSLTAGDRLLIAPIHDRTLTDFRPLLDANLPAKPQFSGWMDNVMKFNRQTKEVETRVTQVKDKVAAEVARVFSKGRSSPYTDVISSLHIAQKLFHNETRRKVLVIMSDMIEDSPAYRFDQISWSPATIEKMLADMEAKGLIARLPGVCVYVSGASAGSAALAEHIGRFWYAYFRRTGADMDPARYSHVLLHWPPSSACRAASPPPAV
jgi:DNA-binding MarR family transcriptional regulator